MKSKKNEIIRIKNIIDQDVVNADDKFNEMLLADFNRLIGDYFEIKNSPRVETIKKNGEIEVTFKFFASAIKNFKFIAKQ